jgi:hypothetical protein
MCASFAATWRISWRTTTRTGAQRFGSRASLVKVTAAESPVRALVETSGLRSGMGFAECEELQVHAPSTDALAIELFTLVLGVDAGRRTRRGALDLLLPNRSVDPDRRWLRAPPGTDV